HPLLQEPLQDFPAVPAHRLGGLGSVGDPGGIAEIDRGLTGQALIDGPRHREAAQSGIEDADGRAIHGILMGMLIEPPTPFGVACSSRSPGKSARWAET